MLPALDEGRIERAAELLDVASEVVLTEPGLLCGLPRVIDLVGPLADLLGASCVQQVRGHQ